MGDYISRTAAIEACCGGCNPAMCSTPCDEVAAIRAIPSADVREVVTCGECRKLYECRFSPYLGINGFCSWGERITNCNADMRGADDV